MLIKEQVQATTDSPAMGAEERRLQRRAAHIVRLYPALRKLPPERHQSALRQAHSFAIRQRALWLGVVLGILWVAQPLYMQPLFGINPIVRIPPQGLWAVAVAFVGYYDVQKRAFLGGLVHGLTHKS